MQIKLGDMCVVTGMAYRRFVTASQREHHRFVADINPTSEHSTRRYTPGDALAVIAARCLSDDNGIKYTDAANIIFNSGGVPAFFEAGRPESFFVGAAEFASPDDLNDRARSHYPQGKNCSLSDWMSGADSFGGKPYRFVILDLGAVYAQLERNARSIGFGITDMHDFISY